MKGADKMTGAKDYIRMIAVTAVALLLIPLVGYAGKRSTAATSAEDKTPDEGVSILMRESGEVVTLSERDYVIGAVFAQMPADFEPEALKAQAVLAYTYAERRRLSERTAPTAELKGAVMSDDTSLYQAYFTEEQAKALYGEDYETARKRIAEAADRAAGLTLCYEGEPVITAFHGISFGHTESAFTMWGEDIPYLVSVESLSDADKEVCRSEHSFNDSEISERVPELKEADISALTIAEKSEHGTVLSLRAGDVLIAADSFCERLGLPSCHFTAERESRGWRFTVMGVGHLVGMSQYGANALAAEGKSCEEILLHYYKDCVIIRK